MADIELVIKISEDQYEMIQNISNFISADANQLIRDGIPLPKGHGRLVDADAILEEPFGNTYKDIEIAETIIKADKVERER